MEQKTPQTKAQKRENIIREETPKKAEIDEQKPSKKNVNKAKTNSLANKNKRVLRNKTQRESKGSIWNLNSTKKGQINEEKPQKTKQRHAHKASPIRAGTTEFKIRLATKKKGQKNN